MRESTKRLVLATMLVALCALVLAAPALAAVQSTTQQITPGMTTRTIWDTVQVAAYKVNASHVGNIHAEVTFKPNWADIDIYIYDPACDSVWEETMGYSAMLSGKEIIDHYVSQEEFTNDPDSTVVLPEDPYGAARLRGLDYYIIIVAFNETAKYQVTGYTPFTDVESGIVTPSDRWNWWYEPFRFPGKKDEWGKIKGAPYGSYWDFKPTSEGTAEARLQWPAKQDADGKWAVTYDPVNAARPANMESYMFVGSDWNEVFAIYDWAYYRPPKQENGAWYGHRTEFDVDEAHAYQRPRQTFHFVPSLVGVVNNAKVGPLSGPKEGKSTIGYKATITYPENLRFRSAPSSVKKGAKATLKGSFALNGAWGVGREIMIQRKANDGTWVKAKTGTVGADGQWTIKVTVKSTGYYRAIATGDPATGLEKEISVQKKIKAT